MLLQKSWHVIPLRADTKLPLFKQWQKKATNDKRLIRTWMNKYPGCNWGLLPSASGLVVIDVDRKGLTEWKRLCKLYGEPQTLKNLTGSRGGLHYVFKHTEGVGYKGKLCPGIDVQFNNYIVIPPSKGARPYKWVNKVAPTPVPDWLKSLIVKTKKAPASNAKQEFDKPFFKALIDDLREKEFDYDTWLNIGMAIHHVSGGSDDGFELWEHLTLGVNFQDGDEALAVTKWESFGEYEGELVTAGTLFKIARDLEVDIPLIQTDPSEIFDDESQKPDAEILSSNKKQVDKKRFGQWGTTPDGRRFTNVPKELVRKINAQGYAVLTGTQKSGGIVKAYRDNYGLLQYTEISNQGFKNLTAHYCLQTRFVGPDGNSKISYKDAERVWLQSSEKKSYRDIVFSPESHGEDVLNLWGKKPIPCEPEDGSVKDILKFVQYIVCSGSEAKAKYVLQWLAHIVQRPERKPSVALVLIGDEGTGKGLLTQGLMERILRGRFVFVDNPQTIKNKFNKDLAFRYLTVIDEACWQNDKELQGILRAKIGNSHLQIEEKFGARFTVEDFTRVIITANTADAVKIQSSNRRYLILEAPKKYARHPLLGKVWDDVKYSNASARFYSYLLNVDLSDFNPHRFPEELDDQGTAVKLEGDIVREFMYDFLIENPKRIFMPEGYVVKQELYKAFQEFVSEVGGYRKSVSQYKLTTELKALARILNTRDTRKKIDGKTFRVFDVTPLEMVTSFYSTMRLGTIPSDFDESMFYIK